MLKLGEILTLNNNKKFVVVSTTNYENNLYCYLSELDNSNNTKIYLVKEDNLIQVVDEILINELENIFANNFVD
jgi:hypothetical protein